MQTAAPELASRADPVIEQLQCLRLDPTDPLAANFLSVDQTVPLQHLKVLEYRGEAQRQMLCQPADGCLAVAETLDHDLILGRSGSTEAHAWFQQNVIATVPQIYAGSGRKVYPGFLQLAGFMVMP